MTVNNIDKPVMAWKGFKEAIVFKKVQEDKNVSSFFIKIKDGSTLPSFIPGQYIAIKVKMPNGSYSKIRQYTLSKNYNEDFYRVSIKREPEGNVSKILCDNVNEGDVIEITAPIGKFVLKDSDRPLILIGGGIGITPMLTMAYDAAPKGRKIHLIYSLPNSDCHSFKEEIESFRKYDNVKITTIYTRPFEKDEAEKRFDLKGRINKEWMMENLPVDGDFYFCGPEQFMRAIYHNLIDMGVDKEQINYELFGPGQDITK